MQKFAETLLPAKGSIVTKNRKINKKMNNNLTF